MSVVRVVSVSCKTVEMVLARRGRMASVRRWYVTLDIAGEKRKLAISDKAALALKAEGTPEEAHT